MPPNKVLLIADRVNGRYTSAHDIAREIKKQGGQYVFLSIYDFLTKKDSASFLYQNGKCSLRLERRSTLVDLTREVKSVLYWRSAALDEKDQPKGMTKQEYSFFSNEWRCFKLGICLSLRDRFWINPFPDNLVLDEKAYQLMLAQQIGFTIPLTSISTSLKDPRRIFKNFKGDIIYKTIYGKALMIKRRKGQPSYRRIFTTVIKKEDLKNLNPEYATPNIIQGYIPKDKEVRVTVIGRAVFAAAINSQECEASKHDWRRGILHLPFRKYNLPEKVAHQCFRLMRRLGLNYCAIDLILTPQGEYVFLELNPHGQYGWIERMTRQPMTKNIARMLIEGRINYKIQK